MTSNRSSTRLVVAIAGATGRVGRSLLQVLSTKSEFELIAFCRKKRDDLEPAARTVICTDYESVNSLASVLTANNVHTVVSALSDDAGEAELNLVAAAEASLPTKRFIAGDWGADFPPEAIQQLSFLRHRPLIFDKLRNTDLEWTRVHNGYFMDDYGRSSKWIPFVIDMVNNAAAIPGSGNEPFAMTLTTDVAEFVALLLELPEGSWEEATYLYGERVTWNYVLRLAEEVKGKPFAVSYDSLEELQKSQITKLPAYDSQPHDVYQSSIQPMFAVFGKCIISGAFDVGVVNSLNRRFPAYAPTKVADFMRRSWQ